MHFVSPLAWACRIMHILYWIATYLFEKHLDPSSMQDDIVFDPGCSAMWLVWFGVVPAKTHPRHILPYLTATTSNCTSCKVVLNRGYICLCDVLFFVFLKKTLQKSPTIMATTTTNPCFPEEIRLLPRPALIRPIQLIRVTPLRIFEKMLQMASEAKLGKEELVADRLVEPWEDWNQSNELIHTWRLIVVGWLGRWTKTERLCEIAQENSYTINILAVFFVGGGISKFRGITS